jgi:hypothetical protein
LADGMRDGQWQGAVERSYGYRDLPALQNTWVDWVAHGFPMQPPESRVMTASAQAPANGNTPAVVAATAQTPVAQAPATQTAASPVRPESNLIYHIRDKNADSQPTPSAIISAARPQYTPPAGNGYEPQQQAATPVEQR